ncbi:hypothetical protein [Lachnoclostridium sp.]|uniref:hypothetical protein n=1 Tax=Lachnoclostridium sp. TaxID=2028282 RepID=UPI0028993CE7|nr:hypothetical protein [Lachnoclostridium sp.]
MFEMRRTKNVQLGLIIISCIALIVSYVQSHSIVRYSSFIVLFTSITINVVINCIRKDVEENFKALQKRCFDEIKMIKEE